MVVAMVITKIYQNTTNEFIRDVAQDEAMQRFRVSDEILAVEASGLKVEGVRYFQDLFARGDTIPMTKRLASIFVGCTAHGMKEVAEEARDRYFDLEGQTEESHHELNLALLQVSFEEKKAGNRTKKAALQIASKELINCRTALLGKVIGEAATTASDVLLAA